MKSILISRVIQTINTIRLQKIKVIRRLYSDAAYHFQIPKSMSQIAKTVSASVSENMNHVVQNLKIL